MPGLRICVGALASAWLLCACHPDPVATQLVIVVETDMDVPDAINRVGISAVDPAYEWHHVEVALSGAGRLAPPLTIGLAYRGGDLAPVSIAAIGWLDDQAVVSASVETAFAPDESRLVELFLRAACAGYECPFHETCRLGRCVSESIDAQDLPRWDGAVRGFERGDAGVAGDAEEAP